MSLPPVWSCKTEARHIPCRSRETGLQIFVLLMDLPTCPPLPVGGPTRATTTVSPEITLVDGKDMDWTEQEILAKILSRCKSGV